VADRSKRDYAETSQRFSATIAALARPTDLRGLSLPALQLIMAMRMCALFESASRDPILELTTRFRSVTAARSVLELAESVRRCWPESFMVHRPCCLALSPDENTLAAMIRAVCGRSSIGFYNTLQGLVRADRLEHLHDVTIRAVAALEAANSDHGDHGHH
jgi:hypothetical protein